MPFRDYFSAQAQQYARHRPQYPGELFDYLASLAPAHECAWDCGAGNGQAYVELARYFQRVIATDASEEQIQNAFPHERVDYRVEEAEKASIPGNSVDLVTVGTAVHWFDFDPFYAEVRRVGKPGAVLAVWIHGQLVGHAPLSGSRRTPSCGDVHRRAARVLGGESRSAM